VNTKNFPATTYVFISQCTHWSIDPSTSVVHV
jgi:hypothetical protein